MNSKRAFEIELKLFRECEEYIKNNSSPKDEIMEACVKAYCAVQEYRKLLQEKDKEESKNAKDNSTACDHVMD